MDTFEIKAGDMAHQYSVEVRNAKLDAIETTIGALPTLKVKCVRAEHAQRPCLIQDRESSVKRTISPEQPFQPGDKIQCFKPSKYIEAGIYTVSRMVLDHTGTEWFVYHTECNYVGHYAWRFRKVTVEEKIFTVPMKMNEKVIINKIYQKAPLPAQAFNRWPTHQSDVLILLDELKTPRK